MRGSNSWWVGDERREVKVLSVCWGGTCSKNGGRENSQAGCVDWLGSLSLDSQNQSLVGKGE